MMKYQGTYNVICRVSLQNWRTFFEFKLLLVVTTAIQHSNLEHQYQLS